MIRVAIVGTGNVAVRSYLPYLSKREDVALSYYNRTRAKAEGAASQFGGRVADSMKALLADEPDTVLVLTRETDRYQAASQLLDLRPKRLFFEKPLVAQGGQERVVEGDFFLGREILQRAQAMGTETAMMFNYRFFDQTLLAGEIIRERGLGRPVHFTALVHYACWSHVIDLVHHFVGPVAQVAALSSQAQRPWGSMSAADVAAAVRTQGDATGTLIGTCGLDFKLPLYELTLAYEGGRIHLRGLDGDMEVLDYASKRHEVHRLSRDTSRWEQYTASFAKALAAYLASLQAGEPPPVPGMDGLRELQLEAALKRSAAEGGPVAPDEAFPLGVTA